MSSYKRLYDYIYGESTLQLRGRILFLHVHILPSVVPFIKGLIDIGFDREKIILISKPYSTIDNAKDEVLKLGITVHDVRLSVTDHSYRKFIHDQLIEILSGYKSAPSLKQIILLDSGGELQKAIANIDCFRCTNIACIELTTQGTYEKYRLPTVEVALSPLKKEKESKVIAAGLLRALKSKNILKSHHNIGVIGCGSIGKAIIDILSDQQYDVKFYDSQYIDKEKNLFHEKKNIISESNIIIGCTGRNSVKYQDVATLNKSIVFVSASSKDTEFYDLLIHSIGEKKSPYEEVVIKNDKGVDLKILNGGFPINFDRCVEYEDAQEIRLTRGLWFIGVLQALEMNSKNASAIPLSEAYQNFLLKELANV